MTRAGCACRQAGSQGCAREHRSARSAGLAHASAPEPQRPCQRCIYLQSFPRSCVPARRDLGVCSHRLPESAPPLACVPFCRAERPATPPASAQNHFGWTSVLQCGAFERGMGHKNGVFHMRHLLRCRDDALTARTGSKCATVQNYGKEV